MIPSVSLERRVGMVAAVGETRYYGSRLSPDALRKSFMIAPANHSLEATGPTRLPAEHGDSTTREGDIVPSDEKRIRCSRPSRKPRRVLFTCISRIETSIVSHNYRYNGELIVTSPPAGYAVRIRGSTTHNEPLNSPDLTRHVRNVY